jgi:hypothetical protein
MKLVASLRGTWGDPNTANSALLLALLTAPIVVVLGSMLARRYYYGTLAQLASPQRRPHPRKQQIRSWACRHSLGRTRSQQVRPKKSTQRNEPPLPGKERPLTKKPPPSKKITSKDHRKACSLTADT